MKLIVGLGNPGKRYEKNRHNVGFMVVEEIANQISKSELVISKQIQESEFQIRKKLKTSIIGHKSSIILAKPTTFMNHSGDAVQKLFNHYSLSTDNLYIICDDLDIRLGKYKIQKGIGPKDHKGLISIYQKLRTKDFWHVRIGVDNRDPENRISGEEYVLQDFDAEEFKFVNQVIDRVSKNLLQTLNNHSNGFT